MAGDVLFHLNLSSAIFAARQQDARISLELDCFLAQKVGLLNLPVTKKADKHAPTLLIAQKKIGKMLMEANSDRLSAIFAFTEK